MVIESTDLFWQTYITLKLLHRLITHRPQTLAAKPDLPPQVRGDSSNAQSKTYSKKETVNLPSSSSDLAMATGMVKNQTTTYIAPIPGTSSIQSRNTVIKKNHRLPPPGKIVTMQNAVGLLHLPTIPRYLPPTTPWCKSRFISIKSVILIAKEIRKTAPQVEQRINPTDGNIKLNAIQTSNLCTRAKGKQKLSYEEPPVVLPKRSKLPNHRA